MTLLRGSCTVSAHLSRAGTSPGRLPPVWKWTIWRLRTYANEHLLNEFEDKIRSATHREDEIEREIYARLMALHAKCGYIPTGGQVRAHCV